MKLLVIDIGGTFIKYAIMDENKNIVKRGKVATPQDSREALIDVLANLYFSHAYVDGISICMPGIIDADRGYCHMGGALRYNDGFAIKDALYERCHMPIHIENDAKCAAYAEAKNGALKDVSDGFVLIFGTMIGGAYIQNGKLHKGKHFSSGEVSYIISDRDSYALPETIWGNRCSANRLCKRYAELHQIECECVDGNIVFDGVKNGDPYATLALEEYAKEIAVQIFNIQTILDVERFAIGGGISARPIFLKMIQDKLKELYDNCLYPITRTEVVNCHFQNDANLYGAYYCYKEKYEV